MEQALLHFVHIAAWALIIIFILALIGLIAIVRWIAALFRRTETAVQSGVQHVEDSLHR